MSITCKITPSYAWRTFFATLACALLGSWGIYHYRVTAPSKQLQFDNYTMLEQIKLALETDPGAEPYEELLTAAQSATQRELSKILQNAAAETGVRILDRSDPNYGPWLVLLLASTDENAQLPESFVSGAGQEAAKKVVGAVSGEQERARLRGTLVTAVALEQLRQPGAPLENVGQLAYNTVTQQMDAMGPPDQPNTFDRVAQWMFMLSLPFAPYFLWRFFTARRRVYRLDDEAALEFPGGLWQAEDIADIDMSQWIAKSVAWLVHRDGTRLKLDDYLYQDLFKIVGAFAAQFYPAEWTEEAKRLPGDDGEPRPATP